jgi:hypothetical protein
MLEKRLKNNPLQFSMILFFRGKQKSGCTEVFARGEEKSQLAKIAMLPLVGIETKMPAKSPGSSWRLMPTRINKRTLASGEFQYDKSSDASCQGLSSMLTQRRWPQVSVFCEATYRACFRYSHGCAILSTTSGLSAYTLYKMTFDAELTEPAIIFSVAAVSQPIRK